MRKAGYYTSSFFWSTLAKVLNAVIGFVSVPLLIGHFGRPEYGVLTLALSFNSYMHLLDLGMNTGAVRYFAAWKATGEREKSLRVARTNITFYLVIALVNALIMVALALFGEGLFTLTHEQFSLLRWCFFSIAVLSVFSWVSMAFNQLLVADKQIAWTMRLQTVQALLKALLIFVTLRAGFSLPLYFFLLTAITAFLVFPFAAKCLKDGLVDSLRPGFFWDEFKVVLLFSLSVFALSFFQVTATQSRPIVLSLFYKDSADTLTDFNIISVVPSLIVAIGGSLTTIFLPGTSEVAARGDIEGVRKFGYRWTRLTSVIANFLCVPFIICASEVISAYVGAENARLAGWMILWCITVLIQIHTTPANSLVLAVGKTRPLVVTTAAACVISIALNILLCGRLAVGSAVVGYFVYVLIVIGSYYLVYYRKVLGLGRLRMFWAFASPTLVSAVLALLAWRFVRIGPSAFAWLPERWAYVLVCVVKTAAWGIPYAVALFALGILDIGEMRKIRRNE